MVKRIFLLIFITSVLLNASFIKGEKLFDKKCSSCHIGYIPMDKLKDNFFSKDNKLLNLKAPPSNLLAYAITRSPKHIGDINDKEMQQVEIEDYLEDYLSNPDPSNSICDESAFKYYDKKYSMKNKLTSKELELLAIYFMEYDNHRLKNFPKAVKTLKISTNTDISMKKAKENNKHILVYATSKTCYYCKKMDREVFSLKDIKRSIDKNYIFLKVDIDKQALPFGLSKDYKGMTPTFFVLTKNKKLLKKYRGSWNEKDFLMILGENIK